MKLLAFAVYDSKSEVYERPMFARTRGEMLRAFEGVVNSADHPVAQHPADYTLFLIGEYNQETGVLTGCTPVTMGNALPLKKDMSAADRVRLEA